jgi:hypothetical protein
MADLRSLFENTPTDPNSLHVLRERIAQIVADTIARGENPGTTLSPECVQFKSSFSGITLKSLRQSRSLIDDLPRLTENQLRDLGRLGKRRTPSVPCPALTFGHIRRLVPDMFHSRHCHLGRRRNSAGDGLARVPR